MTKIVGTKINGDEIIIEEYADGGFYQYNRKSGKMIVGSYLSLSCDIKTDRKSVV